MQMILEALKNGDIGLNTTSIAYLISKNIQKKNIQIGKFIVQCKSFSLLPRGISQPFLHLELYVFCVTVTELLCLEFNVKELNHCPNSHYTDRHH